MTASAQHHHHDSSKLLPHKVPSSLSTFEPHGKLSLRKLAMQRYRQRATAQLQQQRQWPSQQLSYSALAQFAPPATTQHVHSNNQQQRTVTLNKPKKSVRFATTASVRYRAAITKEETKNCWYQPADYASFERERRETITAVKQVQGDLKYLNPKKYCVRGLEQQLSRSQTMERRINTMRCKQVVLEQQHYQRYSGIRDPDSLQAASKMFSGQATKRAHLRAVIDHALAA